MAEWKTATVISWPQFKDTFSGFATEAVAFRGQANETWELEPSLFRVDGGRVPRLNDYIGRMLPEVYHYVSPYLKRSFDFAKFQDVLSFLSLLQHHGFPTCLLDWTYSPYMAAYFAFRDLKMNGHQTNHLRVAYLNARAWDNQFPWVDPMDWSRDSVVCVRPLAESNARVIAQQGRFTLSTMLNVRGFIETRATGANGAPEFGSVRIHVKETVDALRDLDSMGINDQSMFPGLEGTCASLAKKYFMPDRVGKTSQDYFDEFVGRLKSQEKAAT